ncbi:hypothetical protein [Stenoxybacter acetivorans]|uniref:hypothetical protein n=1 Tax=Stenoxybacter acetivorans TaxID=422441 RepID=UPI00055F8246|nr:hypothetical protein [Stenoxybacter acetivorans]
MSIIFSSKTAPEPLLDPFSDYLDTVHYYRADNISGLIQQGGNETELPTDTTPYGDNQDNELTGTPYDDEIYGLAGNDTLYGYYGDDVLNGGDGDEESAIKTLYHGNNYLGRGSSVACCLEIVKKPNFTVAYLK